MDFFNCEEIIFKRLLFLCHYTVDSDRAVKNYVTFVKFSSH